MDKKYPRSLFQGQQQIIVLTYIFSVAISTIIQFSRFKRRNPIEYATIWENRYYNDSDGMKTGDMFKLLLVAQLIIFGFIALMVICQVSPHRLPVCAMTSFTFNLFKVPQHRLPLG
jgi:hypothetical protein